MARKVTFQFQPVGIGASADKEESAGSLPRKSGVFRIFDLNGNLILLDRTHDLSGRIERFQSESSSPRSLDLGRITDHVEFCPTDSPLETLYLLGRERRRWFPETHMKMRTFRRFHLLKVNRRQRFPRLYATQQLKSGVDYFGPFRTRSELDRLKATLERTFKIRACTYNIRGNDPYPDCLYFQTHGCSRPCNGDIAREFYLRDIDAAIAFIRGREMGVTAPLLARMQSLADATRFEEAERIRRRLERIRRARKEHTATYFDLACFDFVAVTRAGSAKTRKIALVRAGRILGFEEHSVDDIEQTVLATIRDAAGAPADDGDGRARYEEFCILSTFLAKPVKSVRLVPLESPEDAARAVAEGISR